MMTKTHGLKKALLCLALFTVPMVALWYSVPQLFFAPLIAANRLSAGLKSAETSAAEHQIRYLHKGEGETVVLLHGIFAEKDHWVDFARALPGNYRLVIPDLPAFGESERKPGADYSYAPQVERLKAILDKLAPGPVHLAGSSMGGTIAALFALKYPERVLSVAFIGAPHGIRTRQISQMDRAIEAGRAPLVVSAPHEFEDMLNLLFARRPFMPYPIVSGARQKAIAEAASNLPIWQAQRNDRYLLDERLNGLKVPLWVLWGAQDRLFDVSGSERVQSLVRHAQARTMPAAGHLPMMEFPGETAALYHSFLQAAKANNRAEPLR